MASVPTGNKTTFTDDFSERLQKFIDATLVKYAAGGNTEYVKEILKQGADVNAAAYEETNTGAYLWFAANGEDECEDWTTALMEAARYGHEECIDVLIQAGADVNEQGRYGFSALMWAVQKDHLHCLKLLVDAGAGVKTDNDRGKTPLMMAAVKSSDKCVTLLIHAGADVNIFEGDNLNALGNLLDYWRYMYGSIKGKTKRTVMLLFAAGEIVDDAAGEIADETEVEVPDFLKNEDLKLNLKHLCREAIRKHLINIDPYQHLFGRIPQIGLNFPSLEKYLLYDMSLDEDETQ